MTLEIVPSIALHARELSLDLRERDILEAERMGLDPRKAVFQAYRKGLYRRTALIDDEVAAMWGVAGDALGEIGTPYLITGHKVKRVSPLRFSRIYRNEVQVMKELFPKLENYVDATYTGAVRMLSLSGFKLGEPEMHNGNLFRRFTMETY